MFIPTGSSVWYTIPVTRHSRIGGCVAAGMADTFQGQTTKVVIAMPGRSGRRRYGLLTVRRTCTQGYPRKMTGKGWQNEKNLDFMDNGDLSFNGRLFIRKYDVG